MPRLGRCSLAFLVLLTLVLIGLSYDRLAFGTVQPLQVQTIPFNGLTLFYVGSTDPIVQSQIGLSASGNVTITFADVTSTTSSLTATASGTASFHGVTRSVSKLTVQSQLPTNTDTALFIRPGTNPPIGGSISIFTGLPAGFQSAFGVSLNFPTSWQFMGTGKIRTSLGGFQALKYTAQVQAQIAPLGTSITTQIILYFEQSTRILVYAEALLQGQGVPQIRIGALQLQQTNAPVAPSRCLIATAAFGSDMAPPVIWLRNFRDGKIMSAYAGWHFMEAFNQWYYAFSPVVAQLIQDNANARQLAIVLLYPMLITLQASAKTYSLFEASHEIGAVLTGIIASLILGAIYLAPMNFLVSRFKGSRLRPGFMMQAWATTAILVPISIAARSPTLAIIGTAGLVMTTMIIGSCWMHLLTQRLQGARSGR